MEASQSREFNLYHDIQARTAGALYLGVVGPVRTGKSTFIKKFMDLCVLPNMPEGHEKQQLVDELPQSSGGRTITTTEPKFIPKQAAQIQLADDTRIRVRLVDCVGFMVEGAAGHTEDGSERMVKTPWFTQEIPFTQAAEIGTGKVIGDHSTVGIVVTTDGSFGELPRENYRVPEEKTITQLQKLKKPFLVILNSSTPEAESTRQIAREIGDKYGVTVTVMNCERMEKKDVELILQRVLEEFPIMLMEFYMPKWVEMLPMEHKLKMDLLSHVREIMDNLNKMRDVMENRPEFASDYVKRCKVDRIDMAQGRVVLHVDVDERFYYEMLSELMGVEVKGEYHLISVIRELTDMKKEYSKVLHAIDSVRQRGYGVVTPERDEILLDKPELIRHGNKFGVKIKSNSPSIHMIRANIETEIAPIVGTQEQAQDLIRYIDEAKESENGIWETNIFGKTIEQLVEDGIAGKIAMIGEESQVKLQDTMQKIVNDSNGGMVCIII